MKNRVAQSNQTVFILGTLLLATPGAYAQCDAANLFELRQDFATGSSPRSVAIGDLNADGIPDIAVANFNSNAVSVMLGNGDGTFQTRQDFTTGSGPGSVAIADLNGDGVPDLAITNYWSNSVSVLLGNGDGDFQTRQDFTTGSGPGSVAIADLNGNSVADLVVVNEGWNSNTVSVLLGYGDGTFQPRQDFSTGSEPRAVAIGDLSGDGVPELVVARGGSNANGSVSILSGTGDGTFELLQGFATGRFPTYVTISDLNDDGLLDLVAANGGSSNAPGNTVSILLNNGDGTFQVRRDFNVGDFPTSVAIGDLNGDGVDDLAVANGGFVIAPGTPGNTVSVLFGEGDGTFPSRQDFVTGSRPLSVAIADLNDNGVLDILVANEISSTVSVLLNQCVPPTPCAPDLDENGALNFFDIAAFLAFYQIQFPSADWNGDGVLNFFDFAGYLDAYNAGCT